MDLLKVDGPARFVVLRTKRSNDECSCHGVHHMSASERETGEGNHITLGVGCGPLLAASAVSIRFAKPDEAGEFGHLQMTGFEGVQFQR